MCPDEINGKGKRLRGGWDSQEGMAMVPQLWSLEN